MLQATIRDKEAHLITGVSVERFTAILDTVGSSKRSVVLPRDAQPFVLHPDSILVWLWEWIMLGVACLYFWEVSSPYLLTVIPWAIEIACCVSHLQ